MLIFVTFQPKKVWRVSLKICQSETFCSPVASTYITIWQFFNVFFFVRKLGWMGLSNQGTNLKPKIKIWLSTNNELQTQHSLQMQIWRLVRLDTAPFYFSIMASVNLQIQLKCRFSFFDLAKRWFAVILNEYFQNWASDMLCRSAEADVTSAPKTDKSICVSTWVDTRADKKTLPWVSIGKNLIHKSTVKT